MITFTDVRATAVGAGRAATAPFARKERSAAPVDSARVNAIASHALPALHHVMRRHTVTYAEYGALKAWLIRVGEDGEWPLLLDLFLEHVVEEVVNAERMGAVGTVEGPFYVPGPLSSRARPPWRCRRVRSVPRCSSTAPSPISTAPQSQGR